jgi:hypothetical protein
MEVSGQLYALPLYSRGKGDRRLCGPQCLSGCCGEEENLVHVRIRTPGVQPLARRYTDCAIPTPVI